MTGIGEVQIGFPKKAPLYSCRSLPSPLLPQEGGRGLCIHSSHRCPAPRICPPLNPEQLSIPGLC